MTSISAVSVSFIAAFMEEGYCLAAVNSDTIPRVINMDEIIAFVSTLVDKGFAYNTLKVMFTSSMSNNYAKLANRTLEDLETVQLGANADAQTEHEGISWICPLESAEERFLRDAP